MKKCKLVQNIMNFKFCYIIFCTIICSIVLSVPTFAKENSDNVIRVGSFEETYNVVNEKGERSGYGYEYLQDIAGYAGWTYKYITSDWKNCFTQLENGEIDILGGISYTDERAENMLFSDMPMGEEKYYIYTDASNMDLTAGNLDSFEGKNIGVFKDNITEDVLNEWESKYGLHTKHINVSTTTEIMDKLSKHEIDCFVSVEESRWEESDISPLTSIGETEIYFAINPERPDIKEALDSAMRRIKDDNPFYTDDLYRRYLSAQSSSFLSKEESEWIGQHGAIRIGYLNQDGGISSVDPSTGKLTGVITDYVDLAENCLQGQTLEFKLNGYETRSELLQALQDGKIDLIFHANQNPYFAETNGFALSDTLLTLNMAAITAKDSFDENKENIVAVEKDDFALKAYLSYNYPQWKVVEYETSDAAVKAMQKGETDCIVSNSGTVSDYLKNNKLHSVFLTKEADVPFAIQQGEPVLLSILNKTLTSMPTTQFSGAVVSYNASSRKVTVKDFIQDNIHELPAGTMEPLTGDRLDGFLEATEQANAIPQPQAWNGIDGLLNGKPFMPEASPADRAAALMELAEKNAPRLGSEERQLIMSYAEAVGDTDKVIGLINRLCEQGYELQKGQMDSFVKSEIESEIAVANAKRQIAQNPAAEPVVTILWSESPHLKDGQQMPLHEAEAVFKELDSARRHEREQPGYTGHWYDKTKFRIDFTMQGQPDSYEGRQDFGDGDGSLIQHIRGYHEYYAQDESWKNHVLHHEGPEAWEADKAQRDMLLHEFVPYMELHCNLAAMEQDARRPLRSGETLTPEQTAYFNAVLDYVKECRPLLNQGQYHLPEPPQLADFDQSLQDYKKQIEAELEQEAAAAGLTVEEYVASDYEAPAQPNFSIYQVPPGPEGRDFRYRSYEDLQADGLSVDRKNYQLVYTAPLDKDTTLDEIYRRFNIEHPADYKGHSLSMGDIVVFRQDGKQTAYYVDEGADYRQVPEFFAQPEKQLTPDECMTGEQIQTPRGRFYLTDRSREQMEAAGYGFHHQSEDGRYLIMANGTRAFAIPAQPESHIKTAEMSTEQNYNMIDGMMNNAPSMEELEARAKAGEQISLLDVAEATKAEAKKPKQTQKTTQKQKKPSIRAQLAAAKEEQKKKPPAREKSKEMEV